MPSHIENLIDQSAQTSRFASSSRYNGLPQATMTGSDGREIVYVLRRFVPSSSANHENSQHTVTEGERPDHLAREAIGDPERYWELCDHNLVRRPSELLAEPGATVLLPGGALSASTGFYPI